MTVPSDAFILNRLSVMPYSFTRAESVALSSESFPCRFFLPKTNFDAGIRNSIYKNSITLFLSEVLYRVVKDGTMEQGLFEWCEKNILLLDAMESDFSNFHIRFLLELTVVLGFSPSSEDFLPFSGAHQELMERLLRSSFSESMLIPMSGELRNALAEEILRYIEYHIESSVNINSLKVLRELFRS